MEVNQGEIVGFLGPNGAGKTTSFYMITGQIVPNEGRIFIDDDELTGLPMYKRSQKGVGYLPQEASVFRKMSVEDNIMSVMEMTRMTKAQREARLEQLIDEFNLSKVRKSKGIQLSGGERRRCEIARALAVDPKFILLDEPFAGVDPIAVEDIQYIIAKLKYRNIGVIITDHNVGETLAITDRAYLLYEGTILQEGTPEELAADEDALKALARYWVARFGAYPVLWTLAQEIDNDSYAELGGRFFDYSNNPWVKIAEYVHAADPYSHPLSAHQENAVNTCVTGAGTEPEEAHADGNGVSAFLPEPVSERTGHNWWAAQWSPPLHETPGPEAVRDYWLSDRPAVNYEGRYCGLWTMNFGSRAQGWISFLSGFCGYGYGAADIWLYHSGFEAQITSFDGVEYITPELKATPWQEALEYPSALQMRHLRSLLESFDWWNLTPVIPGDAVFQDASGAAVYAHTPRVHLLYFYGKNTRTGRISTLKSGDGLEVRWYNPRSGEYQEAALPVREADGFWTLPSRPDPEDWVLCLFEPSDPEGVRNQSFIDI